jgi:hypothetical protein
VKAELVFSGERSLNTGCPGWGRTLHRDFFSHE